MTKQGDAMNEILGNFDHNLRAPGAISIYSDFLHQNRGRSHGEEYSDRSVFLERKFRDYVMEWLYNGKPKLFRSETEGNMIVMLTNINFVPVENTSRRVYSLSATITEIAENNLENLLLYDLLPITIEIEYQPAGDLSFYIGIPGNLAGFATVLTEFPTTHEDYITAFSKMPEVGDFVVLVNLFGEVLRSPFTIVKRVEDISREGIFWSDWEEERRVELDRALLLRQGRISSGIYP